MKVLHIVTLRLYGFFLSLRWLPCTEPPWGTLTAIDLDTGEHLWNVPLGTSGKDLAPSSSWWIKASAWVMEWSDCYKTSGATFRESASSDHYLRAFNTETGEEFSKI